MTSQCKTGSTTPPTPTGTTPYPTGTGTTPYPPGTGTSPGIPRPAGDAGRYPLYDAGFDPSDLTNATPAPTAPRPADSPSDRPAPGVQPSQIGYSDNNPYGENQSYTDGGKSKKKKNAAKDSGGCAVTETGAPTEIPSSAFLLAGLAAILAGRRRKR
jgi:MYXO-CTERM domain-containing protein